MIVRTVGPGGQTVPGPGQPQGQRVVMTTQGQQIIRTATGQMVVQQGAGMAQQKGQVLQQQGQASGSADTAR